MTTLLEIFNLIDEARTKGDVDELTALYKKYEYADFPPNYLVRKARAIQLSNGADYSLDDAELCLLKAVKIDPMCVEAFIELGCLYDAVYDNPCRALDLFNHAYTLAIGMLAEIDSGRASVLLQLGLTSEAFNIVNDPKYFGVTRFDSLRNEID